VITSICIVVVTVTRTEQTNPRCYREGRERKKGRAGSSRIDLRMNQARKAAPIPPSLCSSDQPPPRTQTPAATVRFEFCETIIDLIHIPGLSGEGRDMDDKHRFARRSVQLQGDRGNRDRPRASQVRRPLVCSCRPWSSPGRHGRISNLSSTTKVFEGPHHVLPNPAGLPHQ
jgi:hypothetical protein